MLRSDTNDDGYLDWQEREKILGDLAEGMSYDSPELFRRRIFYSVGEHLTGWSDVSAISLGDQMVSENDA